MITAPERKQYPIPDEGRARLQIAKATVKLQVSTPYGPKDKLLFTFDVDGTDNGEGNPRRVWKEFYMGFGAPQKPSQLRKFVEAVLGRKLATDELKAFDEQALVGKTIEAEIIHNTNEDTKKTYANIDEFYKNRPQRNNPAVEKKVEDIAQAFNDDSSEVPF